MKFSWKVFFWTISVVAATFSIGSYILISSVFHTSLNREVKLASDENLMIRFAFETAFANVPTKYEILQDSIIRQICQSIAGENMQTGRFIRLSDENMTTLYQTRHIGLDNSILNKTEESALSYQMAPIDGEYFMQAAVRLTAANRVLYLETFRDITSVFKEREGHFAIYRRLTAAMLLVVSIVMFSISVWLTRPISDLSGAVRAIAEGDLQKRLKKIGDDEIGSLTQDFNSMADALTEKVFKLQEYARQREEFAISFAHELKTPLTSIIGYADMIRSCQLDEEKQFRAANYIFKEGKRLETLSLKLMDMVILRRRDLEKKAVHTSVLFENISELFKPILEPKKITLKVDYDESVIVAEMDLMEMLLVNLIDNAQKVTKEGGVIEFSGEITGQGYAFLVKDFGCGIAKNELSKITEAFYMVDKSRSGAQKGAGLGLAICAEIASLYHSQLEFESELGQGTIVRFLLKNEGEA